MSIIELTFIFRKRAKTLTLVPLCTGLIALLLTHLIKPTFTTTATILPPQQQSAAASMLGALGGLAGLSGGSIGGLKNPADQWVAFLKSQTIADKIIDRYGLMKTYATDYRFLARKVLAGNSRFFATKDGLISIEVDDENPQRAAAIATSYIDYLRQIGKEMALTEAAQRRAFFEQQLKDARDQLAKAENNLKQSGINKNVLKTNPQAAITVIAELEAKIRAQEVAVSVLQQSLTANNPDLQRESAELGSLRKQLQAANRTGDAAPKDGEDYVTKYRDFKYHETLYEMMARQFELAKLDEARDGTLIQVLDAPDVPEYKSSPKRAKIALVSAVIALFFSTLFVLIKNSIDELAKTPDGRSNIRILITGETEQGQR